MWEDIKNGRINCVVVKDLSRFGRNTIETSNYIEVIFPMLKVRFISLTDQIDSYLNPQSINGLLVPFKNIMNDEYARDISVKVKSAQNTYRNKGLFIGSFPSYGYIKDPNDKHKLIIDEEASAVVKQIFQMYLSGMGFLTIAKKLTNDRVKSPFEYKVQKGYNYKTPVAKNKYHIWRDTTIQRILTNQMYVGDMVQGTRSVINYRNHKIKPKSKEEWVIVRNTHEAIISREDFDKVQNMLQSNKKDYIKPFRTYVLGGLVKCGDCGAVLETALCSSKNLKNKYYFRCPTYMLSKGLICSKHTIRNDYLEATVFQIIKKYIELSVDIESILKKIKLNTIQKECQNQNAKLDFEIKKLKDKMSLLYIKFKNNELSEEFLTKKDDYSFFQTKSNQIKDAIEQIIRISLSKKIDERSMQVLAPMYKGENGIDNLNNVLQSIYNPRSDDKNEINYLDVTYREGDKVLQLVNDLDNNVFNGDIGYIESINGNKVEIDFEGNTVEYEKKNLKQIKHAYAITIHKSQGSEFEHVIMPISTSYFKMLYNKLVYTGVSRAKKTLTIVGDPMAFARAVANNYSANRKTSLKTKIIEVYNEQKAS